MCRPALAEQSLSRGREGGLGGRGAALVGGVAAQFNLKSLQRLIDGLSSSSPR